jgi:uncharacterized protein (DUF2147 family)
MIKKISLLSLLSVFTFCSSLMAQSIVGLWKTINDKTMKAESVVAVYEYQGKCYGRIIATFNKESGKIDETIYNPKTRAPGVKGHPYYCGMDLMWDLEKTRFTYKGKIIDPEHGKIYTCETWVKNGDLIVRGEVFVFGRNEVWLLAKDSDFPSGFKQPDTFQFIPVIPQVE